MKKKNKIIIWSISILLVALSVGGYFVGDYFVEYSLGRKEVGFDDPLSPTYDKSIEEQTNRDNAGILVEEFLETTAYNEINIETHDGLNLYAKEFLQNDSDLWVIIVHGYTSYHYDVLDYAANFYEQGFNVITPDLRAHGQSDGDYISMGYYDGKDVAYIANYIVGIDSDAQIVLHGHSMGGATVMMAAGDVDLPSNVIAVIEDSGYTNAYQMFVEQLESRFGLPSFPVMNIAKAVGQLKAGYDLNDANPMKALENSSLPILFIHGDEDGFVLPYMQFELYNSYESEKEILTVEGADHVASRYVDPELYYSTVFNFISKYIK